MPFGAYVQANHETTRTSSNVTRTLDAIYLQLAQNQQGGHELMDLNSSKLRTHNIVQAIPVTDVIIKAVKPWLMRKLLQLLLNSRIET